MRQTFLYLCISYGLEHALAFPCFTRVSHEETYANDINYMLVTDTYDVALISSVYQVCVTEKIKTNEKLPLDTPCIDREA